MNKKLNANDITRLMGEFNFKYFDSDSTNYDKYKKAITGGALLDSKESNGQNKFEADKELFHTDVDRAMTMAVKRIEDDYPHLKGRVTMGPAGEHGLHRSLEDQATLEKGGSSGASLSLHNFGGAQDIGIFIDNNVYYSGNMKKYNKKYNITGTDNLHKYVGGAIRDINELEGKNYFWGWKWDSAHIGMTRFPDQLLSQYGIVSGPEMSIQDLHNWYSAKKDTALAKHKIALNVMDSIYNANVDRIYIGDPGTRDDELLEGITFNRLD